MDVSSKLVSEREERVNEVIAAYLGAVEVGERLDPQEWLRRHPDIAEDLASFLAAKEGFEQQAGPLIPTGAEEPGQGKLPLAAGETPQVGDYLLLEEIARGGMGVVYRAWQKSLGRTVAVKMIRAGELASAEDVRRFRAEAELAAGLDHPNIVPIYEVGQHDGQHFFSMRLIESESLAHALGSGLFGGVNKEAQRRAAGLLAEVARAVHYAHQRGLLHRDLKPANILLDESGRPHVSDFGLAKRVASPEGQPLEQAHLTHSHAVLGTASYMAPEQAAGRVRQLTTAADVYSLGAILYEMLTGRPPFRDDNTLAVLRAVQEQEPPRPRALVPAVAADLETICLKCLEKESGRRYGSAETLAEDLERFLAGEPIRARPSSRLERLAKWARRRPGIAALTIAVVAVTLLGMAGMVWQWQDARDEEGKALQAKADAEGQAVQARKAQGEAERLGKAEREAEKQAQAERDRTAQALKRAEGLHLTAQASIALPTDPTLSLLLAAEGVRRAPGVLANNTLRAALEACHEERPAARGAADFTSRSADGRRVLQINQDCQIKVLEAATGKVIRILEAPGSHSMNAPLNLPLAALSPDGKRVAYVPSTTWVLHFGHLEPPAYGKVTKEKGTEQIFYTDRVVRLWDVETGKQTAVLKGHTAHVGFLAFSPDGKSLVTTSADLTARVWEASTGKELAIVRGFTSSPRWAVFSPDGRRLLAVNSGLIEKFLYPDQNPVKDGESFAQAPAAERRTIDPPELLGTDPGWRKAKEATWISLSLEAGSSVAAGSVFENLGDTATGQVIPLRVHGPTFPGLGMGPHPTAGAFTANGRQVVVAYKGTRVKARVWDAETGKLLYTCRDEEPLPGCATVAISPDAMTVLSIAGRLAYLDCAADRSKEMVLKGHTDDVLTGCFSPDGLRAVTAGKDGLIRVWDAQTGEEDMVLRGNETPVQTVRFSSDGRHLVSIAEDRTNRVWGLVPEPAAVRVLAGHKGPVRSLDFSPSGKRLVTGGQDGTARVWDADTGKAIALFQPPAIDKVLRDLGLSENEATILSLGERFPLGPVLSVQFSPSGKQVLFLGRQESLVVQKQQGQPCRQVPFTPARILDAATGRQLLAFQADPAQVDFAAFSPDGRWVVTAEGAGVDPRRIGSSSSSDMSAGVLGREAYARVYDAATGKEVCRMAHAREIRAAWFSPGSDRLATSTLWSASIWQVPEGKKLKHLGVEATPVAKPRNMFGNPPPIFSPMPSGQGPGLSSGMPGPSSLPSGGSLPYPALAFGNPQYGAAGGAGPSAPFLPLSRLAAAPPVTPQALPGPPPDPKAFVIVPNGMKGPYEVVAGPALLSPDGRRLLVHQPPRVLDLETGKLICKLDDNLVLADFTSSEMICGLHDDLVLTGVNVAQPRSRYSTDDNTVAPLQTVNPFSPDGRRLVGPTGDRLNPAMIWDAATGKVLCRLRGHLGRVNQARFSPDGRLVVTVSADQTARVWDAASGQELHTLKGHRGPVLFAAFSPDGKRVATAGADGTTRVWELELLALAVARRPRELTPEERQRYEVGEDK